MTDPCQVLGLPPDSDDETIRRRYLELVRQNPPSQNPERFAAIRQAYEQLKDMPTRLRSRLFEPDQLDSMDKIIEELACQSSRRRVSLETLLSMVRKP